MEDYELNDHNKDEFPPAHTAEHLLNQLMMRMFGCERSRNAHVERKKSKISYVLDHKPDRKEEREIERVNAFLTAIVQNAPIALYARAENGRILLRNKQCMQVFGHIFGPVDENGLDDNVGGVMLEEDEGNNKAFYHDREWEVLNSGKTLDIPEEEYK